MALDTTPYWTDSASMPRFSRIDRNLTVDVAIVGAGITGITAAYLFKKAGYKVALLERDRCDRVDSANTTAHLTSVTDTRLHKLVKKFGPLGAKRVWDAGAAAIDQIAALIRAEEIRCDFKWVPGYLHSPVGHEDCQAPALQAENKVAARLGIQAEYVAKIPYFGVHGVRFANQAVFHPRKYLAGLIQRIPGAGSHVFEMSPVEAVTSRPLGVKSGDYRVHCQYLVFATHNPLMGKTGLIPALVLQGKLALYTSYALSAEFPAGLIPEASFWDTAHPYHYLRVEHHRHGDYAIFGGEDHKTGQEVDTPAVYKRLERRFRKLLPEGVVEHRWSGQVIETSDGSPLIGETAARQFVATGFSGNGMTFGTLGAMMAVDACAKRNNPWKHIFDIHRKPGRGGSWRYFKENIEFPYYFLRDWTARAESDSLQAVRRGQGKIINLDGKKTAAYRDAAGKISLCSPVCTHLKCIVGWNAAEKTWDCPCHGSRFDIDGVVLRGPATQNLEAID